MLDNIPVSYMLGQTLKAFKNKMGTKLKENDVELSFELSITLFFLSCANKNPTQQDMAKLLQKDKSLILRQINTLIEKKYVVRIQDQSDKRKKKLILTKKGEDTLESMRNIGRQVEKELLCGIADKDLSLFREILSKIQSNAGLEEEYYICK